MSLVHRYYDTATGQFLAVDPDVAQTGQPYTYTGDDPVNAVDPLGLSWYDPNWVHKAIHRFARGVDKVGHFVATHKQAVITAAVIIATLPLDETGIGEAIDADVIGADVTADGAADVVSDEIASEGTQAASAANATDEAATEGAGDFPESDPGVAIGEDMANRVQPFADRVGADTYQPDPTAPEEQWEQNQRDWINKQMDDGRTLRDCGPAPGNPNFPQISSRWYGIEKGEIAKRNYPVTPVDC